jgi:hypothetical protein
MHAFEESFAQVRANCALRRFRWIERRIFENLGKNIAHLTSLCDAK